MENHVWKMQSFALVVSAANKETPLSSLLPLKHVRETLSVKKNEYASVQFSVPRTLNLKEMR